MLICGNVNSAATRHCFLLQSQAALCRRTLLRLDSVRVTKQLSSFSQWVGSSPLSLKNSQFRRLFFVWLLKVAQLSCTTQEEANSGLLLPQRVQHKFRFLCTDWQNEAQTLFPQHRGMYLSWLKGKPEDCPIILAQNSPANKKKNCKNNHSTNTVVISTYHNKPKEAWHKTTASDWSAVSAQDFPSWINNDIYFTLGTDRRPSSEHGICLISWPGSEHQVQRNTVAMTSYIPTTMLSEKCLDVNTFDEARFHVSKVTYVWARETFHTGLTFQWRLLLLPSVTVKRAGSS